MLIWCTSMSKLQNTRKHGSLTWERDPVVHAADVPGEGGGLQRERRGGDAEPGGGPAHAAVAALPAHAHPAQRMRSVT